MPNLWLENGQFFVEVFSIDVARGEDEPAFFLFVPTDQNNTGRTGPNAAGLTWSFRLWPGRAVGVAINLISRRAQTVEAVTVEITLPGDKLID